jgi:hypothetical protein
MLEAGWGTRSLVARQAAAMEGKVPAGVLTGMPALLAMGELLCWNEITI